MSETEWEPSEDQCCECDQVAVGYSDGFLYCTEHYRSRPVITDEMVDAELDRRRINKHFGGADMGNGHGTDCGCAQCVSYHAGH